MKNTSNVQMNNMLQMLNNNQNPTNPSYVQPRHINTNLNKWINQTRDILIKTEQRSLTTRTQQWTKIINTSVNTIAQKLHLSTNHLPKCKEMSMNNTYLNYIMKYNIPITTNNTPTNINECISHGHNWLNARRGQQYSLTFYPDTIRYAAKHSSNLSRFMYGNNSSNQEMYHNALMYQCIYRLFDTHISIDDKQIYLLDPTSIKVNPNKSQQNTIAQCIAHYAQDTQFYAKFDTHAKKAKFFKDKYDIQIMELMQSLNKTKEGTTATHSTSPSAPPLPPPPNSYNNSKKEQDEQTEISSVFSASSNGSNDGKDTNNNMPQLQKPNKENDSNTSPFKPAPLPNPHCKIEKGVVNVNVNKNMITQPEKPAVPMNESNNNNNSVNGSVHSTHTPVHRPNVSVATPMQTQPPSQVQPQVQQQQLPTQTQTQPQAQVPGQGRGNVMGAFNNSIIHQHQSNINHNNNQIKQLLQTMNDNNMNVNGANTNINSNKHMNVIPGNMMNNNNNNNNNENSNSNNNNNNTAMGNVPIVTFTNQQHKMILHLLNQLISTYNRQQMNIVYLNNRVQQLECALAKQTAKVEAIELKANANNKKHKHSHHRHNTHHHQNNNVSPNQNMNTNVNIPNSNNPAFRFQGNRPANKPSGNMNVRGPPSVNTVNSNNRRSPKSINMQNVDALSAKKILRAHGIELNQLVKLIQHIPQNQMRSGMNTPSIGPQRQNNNTTNNNNHNIIVNGNPNINQIQMRVPMNGSNSNNNAPPNNNSNNNNSAASLLKAANSNPNLQGFLNILLGNNNNSNSNVGVSNLVRRQSTGNMNMRPNNNINSNIAVAVPGNKGNNNNNRNHMPGIPTLGKTNMNVNNAINNNNNNNMNRNTNVAALMVPSLPTMKAPNPNIRPNNMVNNNPSTNNNPSKNVIKENKVKIKKQPTHNTSSATPVLGAQNNRKRNQIDASNNNNNNETQPPQKKRRMDAMNMNNNTNNNNNNSNISLGNIMNNPAMLQMLINQVSQSGNNMTHTQNQ